MRFKRSLKSLAFGQFLKACTANCHINNKPKPGSESETSRNSIGVWAYQSKVGFAAGDHYNLSRRDYRCARAYIIC